MAPPPRQTPPHVPMRQFGQASDLDLDFERTDRPSLITAVLARCSVHDDPSHWWSQPVGERTAALVRLVALGEPRGRAPMHARCVADGCGASFEFDLPLHEVGQAAASQTPLTARLPDGRSVTLRLPTGDDLRRWREGAAAAGPGIVRTMVNTLVVDGQPVPGDEAALAAALADADPLVDFTVTCRCPSCDAPNEVEVDLEALSLARLAARQRALLRDVHTLASQYGWTESEVLAVSPARRARYLALIEASR